MITNTYSKVFVTYVTRQHRHGGKLHQLDSVEKASKREASAF